MGQEFRDEREHELEVSPEQVWEAITTGPGVDSWFMGRTTIVPGAGGSVSTSHGPMTLTSQITGWEPLRRFAHRGEPGPDGRFIAYEFLIEGRDRSTTTVRLVASGFLPGDDWEEEYEAMVAGGALYFRTLVEYLAHFPGRRAVPVTALMPPGDLDRSWHTILQALRVPADLVLGQAVRLVPNGLAPIDGTVDFLTADTLGVRSPAGLYRFFRGFFAAGIGHHLFSAEAADEAAAWSRWLEDLSVTS